MIIVLLLQLDLCPLIIFTTLYIIMQTLKESLLNYKKFLQIAWNQKRHQEVIRMIFKLSTLGYIIDWDKATLKEKDAMMRALERVRTAYIFETRRIIKNSEDAKDCSSQIQELMPFIGHKCKSHDIVGVFKGVEETWEDYYYIIELEDGKVSYNTMVDTIEFID